MAEENVVAQDQGHSIVTDEISSYQQSLGDALGTLLHLILDREADVTSVSQQSFEKTDIRWRRY